ncbi:MAG: BACON domain-containing protein [Fermentimonas sp.]|jgi:hypothetical protein
MRNKKILLTLVIVAMIAMFWSCNDDDNMSFLNLDKETITLSEKQASEFVNVTSGAEWRIEGMPEWLSATPTEGNGDNDEVIIIAGDNNTFEQRTAVITFINGDTRRQLKVVQLSLKEAEPFIMFSETRLNGTLIASNVKVELVSNSKWKMLSKPEWIVVDKTSGEGPATLSVSFAENYSRDDRSGELLFAYDDDKTIKLPVSQGGLEKLIISPWIAIFRSEKMQLNGSLSYCNITSRAMIVDNENKEKIYLGNLLSHNITEGRNIPQFAGYTFKPINVTSSIDGKETETKSFVPSAEEQQKYAQEVIATKPEKLENFTYSTKGNVGHFYSYRLLSAVGQVNFGLKLDELINGKSYKEEEMDSGYGLIYSFKNTLFTLNANVSDGGSVIDGTLKSEDKSKGVSYVSSVGYGKIGLLVVETADDSRMLEDAISKYIVDEGITDEAIAAIESAKVNYVYFGNNHNAQVLKGGFDAVKAFKAAMGKTDYDNVYPITFKLSDFYTHKTNDISYSLKFGE